jgi:hypothetical protein
MRHARLLRPGNIVLLLPCVAVLVGLDYLRSAWAAILLYHAVIVIYLLFTRRDRPRAELFHGWNNATGAGITLVCACCWPLLVLLWPVISDVGGGLSSALDSFGLHGTSWWVFATYFVSLHPVLEEIFWRDALGSRNSRIDIVDIAFAAYHVLVLVHFLKFPWAIIVFISLTLISWLWRRIAERYHGLAIPIISHITAGLGIMIATYMIARG